MTASPLTDAVVDDHDDVLWPPQEMTDATVAFLARRAGLGDVLDMGCGSGRVALPLSAALGRTVHAVDVDAACVARLRAKPGSERVEAAVADCTALELGRTFGLVYIVDATFNILGTIEDQRACFRSAARHLEPGGLFVVDAVVPPAQELSARRWTLIQSQGDEHLLLGMFRHDARQQRCSGHYVLIQDGQVRLFPMSYRYLGATELDLVAELEGFEVVERFGGWDGEPVSADGNTILSVFRRVPA